MEHLDAAAAGFSIFKDAFFRKSVTGAAPAAPLKIRALVIATVHDPLRQQQVPRVTITGATSRLVTWSINPSEIDRACQREPSLPSLHQHIHACSFIIQLLCMGVVVGAAGVCLYYSRLQASHRHDAHVLLQHT